MLKIQNWEVFESPRVSHRPKSGMKFYFGPVDPQSSGRMDLMSMGDAGVMAYGVFMMLVEMCAGLPIERRGKLSKSSGEPMPLQHLALKLGIKQKTLEIALDNLASVGWIIKAEPTQTTCGQELPEIARNCPEVGKSGHVLPVSDPRGEEKRGDKRIGEERIGDKGVSRFKEPDMEEVFLYCESQALNVDVDNFMDHYRSNGWKVGKNKMKDWKAAVRGWSRRNDQGKTLGRNKPETFQQIKEERMAKMLSDWQPKEKEQ